MNAHIRRLLGYAVLFVLSLTCTQAPAAQQTEPSTKPTAVSVAVPMPIIRLDLRTSFGLTSGKNRTFPVRSLYDRMAKSRFRYSMMSKRRDLRLCNLPALCARVWRSTSPIPR